MSQIPNKNLGKNFRFIKVGKDLLILREYVWEEEPRLGFDSLAEFSCPSKLWLKQWIIQFHNIFSTNSDGFSDLHHIFLMPFELQLVGTGPLMEWKKTDTM